MKKHIVKKAVVLSVAGVMAATMFTGCGKDKEKNASARKVVEYNVGDYVTLGKYTGLDVEEKITAVTEQDLEDSLQSLITSNTTYEEVTDRNVMEGDKVTMDYTRSVEGEEDINQTDYEITIGDGSLGEEFDENMLGLAANATITFTVKESSTDSETNETTEIDAMYTVTVKSIKEPVVPELTDEFIAANTDYETIDAYREGKRAEMEENNAESAKQVAESELMDMIMEDSEVSGCPAFVYNINYNSIVQYYAMYGSYFGGNLETYMVNAGITFEDLQNQAVDATKQTLVIEAIVKDAGIDITEEQFEEKLEEYAQSYGSKEAVLQAMTHEELLFDMRREVAIDYIYENNNVKQVTVSSDTQ